MATYDGTNIFGTAVQIDHVPQATAQQISAFFGVTGTQTLFGGGRGRAFMVRGVMTGSIPADLRASEILVQSYADGVARILVDTYGYTWPNVIFKGEFQYQGPMGFAAGGVAREYRAVFYGLT